MDKLNNKPEKVHYLSQIQNLIQEWKKSKTVNLIIDLKDSQLETLKLTKSRH